MYLLECLLANRAQTQKKLCCQPQIDCQQVSAESLTHKKLQPCQSIAHVSRSRKKLRVEYLEY
jgi:hypothetical protein